MTNAGTLPPLGRTYRNPDNEAAPSENQQNQQDPSEVDKAPAWFSKTMHQFNTKLQQIENHFMKESVKWPHFEGTLLKQNDRIGNIENKVFELNALNKPCHVYKYPLNTLREKTRMMSSKMTEYD